MEKDTKVSKLREINIYTVIQTIRLRKKLYAETLGIVFVLSCIIILSVPRYYSCSVKLAPEATNSSLGGLSGISSALGIDMGNITSQDAIIPEFYPDVMKSVNYTTDLFKVRVTTKDGKVNTNYYDYLCNYQQSAWWMKFYGMTKQLFKKEPKSGPQDIKHLDPFRLTKKQNDIAILVSKKIKSKVDKKTDVITITVTDQDPLICATLADSVKMKLQQFIIKYRTGKAQNDLNQAEALCKDAREKYLKAQRLYASYSDANEELVLQSFKAKQEELENEMQLKYNNYQVAFQQVQMARAKVQEKTPAFTTLQEATVPLKPAGPKRMIFVGVCLLLTFIGTTIYVFRKNI